MQSPIEHARTPSLTHSRASSSDSGSGSSISSSFQYKPLPALPEPPNFDSLYALDSKPQIFRPASVAVLEQIDELSGGTFARKNSVETPAHIYLPHLDLASREEISPAHSPASSSNPTPRAGSLTVRQLSRSPSPTPGWTPRGSAFSTNSDLGDDSLSGPFALEASLAKLDVLSEEEDEEEQESSRQILIPLNLEVPSPAAQTVNNKPSGSFRDKPDFSSYTWESLTAGISTFLGVAPPKSPTATSPKGSPHSAQFVVSESNQGETSPTSEAQGRLSVRIPKLSRSGWRGWRSGSQAATPVTRTSGDYPSIFIGDHADDLTQALESEIKTAHEQNRLEVSTPNGSPKPKLSPEFTFGRGTPSPRLRQTEQESPSTMRTFREDLPSVEHFVAPRAPAQAKKGHSTSRAASEDHIVVQDNRQWSWQGSSSTNSLPQTRLSHRTRLHLRKTATNQGPRNFAQSYDTNELQRLRESANGKPKYEWI